nr:MAG TPA: hypothetical protein [Caudoviricetes sp.]
MKFSIRFKIYLDFSTILGTFRLFGPAIGTSLHLAECIYLLTY